MSLDKATIVHPNGAPVIKGLERPNRGIDVFFVDIFPDNYLGRLLKGILVQFLIKQEPRMGWAQKSACDDPVLLAHPCESVAAHQWGVSLLILILSREANFQEEVQNFDLQEALAMAIIHDVAELDTGDITPRDGISPEEKHKREKVAMDRILGTLPKDIGRSLHGTYDTYEARQSIESKFVKDCDKLDFILTAFLLERQGFSEVAQFYHGTVNSGFHTKIARDLAELLVKTREELLMKDSLYVKSC